MPFFKRTHNSKISDKRIRLYDPQDLTVLGRLSEEKLQEMRDDPDRRGGVIFVYEDIDGTQYTVDGRHRVTVKKELGEVVLGVRVSDKDKLGHTNVATRLLWSMLHNEKES